MKRQQAAMVVLSGAAEHAVSACFHGFHGNAVADIQVRDSVAEIDDLSAQLVTHDDGIFDASEWMRRIAGSDRAVVVLVEITTANPVIEDAQLDVSRAYLRFRDIFQA